MKHWNKNTHEFEENKKVDDFLDDIIRVYQKHDMSISHEDTHGAFVVTELTKYNILWLKEAMMATKSAQIGKSKLPKEKKENKKKGQFKFFK